jgi:hypothetical protein
MDVQEVSSRLLGRGVLVKYRHATGDEENLELWGKRHFNSKESTLAHPSVKRAPREIFTLG